MKPVFGVRQPFEEMPGCVRSAGRELGGSAGAFGPAILGVKVVATLAEANLFGGGIEPRAGEAIFSPFKGVRHGIARSLEGSAPVVAGLDSGGVAFGDEVRRKRWVSARSMGRQESAVRP